jgi:hypothetical protein
VLPAWDARRDRALVVDVCVGSSAAIGPRSEGPVSTMPVVSGHYPLQLMNVRYRAVRGLAQNAVDGRGAARQELAES